MALRILSCSVRVTTELDTQKTEVINFKKLTSRQNGYSNRKIAYKCSLIGVPGNLIILKIHNNLYQMTDMTKDLAQERLVNYGYF